MSGGISSGIDGASGAASPGAAVSVDGWGERDDAGDCVDPDACGGGASALVEPTEVEAIGAGVADAIGSAAGDAPI